MPVTDSPILTDSRPGWLKFGEAITGAMTPSEAVASAFPWKVEQLQLSAADPKGLIGPGSENPDDETPLVRYDCPGWVANLRSDTGATLGVVKESYRPMQNFELARTVYAIAEQIGDIEIETAGTFKGGRVVYMLARTKSLIRVGETGQDVSIPYLSFLNGHDGGFGFAIQPTTYRLSCLNAYRMMLGENVARLTFRHSQGMMDRVAECIPHIRAAMRGIDLYAQQAQALSRMPVADGDYMDFYRKVFEGHWYKIPADPKTDKDKAQVRRAGRILTEWRDLSRSPRNTMDGIGGTAWSHLQAITEWADHSKTVVGDNGTARVHANLFGDSHRLKARAHAAALELV